MTVSARLLAALALVLAPSAAAEAQADARIRTIPFASDQVTTLQAAPGYAVVVEFADDERVDTIVVGNSSAWQVTANKRGDELVVKPASDPIATNMVVTTDMRRYVFMLEPAADSSGVPFVVRFDYPQASASAPNVSQIAARYVLRGASWLFPIDMSDDGRNTTVRWDPATPLPAIVAVDGHDRETVVNGRMVDGAFLIEGVAGRYFFRRDKDQATAQRRPVKAQ